jgi:TorA maturation chaperone TorD
MMPWNDYTGFRSMIYAFLADAFFKPDAEIFTAEYFEEIREAFRELEQGNLTPGLELKFAGIENCFYSNDLYQLVIEYGNLFYGPKKLLAPPYESVYRENRQVMGQSTIDVLRQYQQAGVEMAGGLKDMPDHICAELEFLHILTARQEDAETGGQDGVAIEMLKLQEFFLRQHLLQWIDEFAAKIKEMAELEYYPLVAELAIEFLQLEYDNIIKRLREQD